MSSTTESRAETRRNGQILVIFAFSIVAMLAVAALVFDVGQNLFDRRIIQDGADAAALAGAKYLGGCANPCNAAINAARDVAARNGHTSGVNGEIVTVSIPPGPEAGEFAGAPGYLEVLITKQRPAFFASVLGQSTLRVSALAVAKGSVSGVVPYAFLGLNKTTCSPAGGTVGGNNKNFINGPIHTNSTCPTGPSMRVAGTNTQLTAPVCTTSGTFSSNSGVPVACTPEEHVPQVEDPLASLSAPALQPYPANVVASRGNAPDGCPGSPPPKPATAQYPRGCKLSTNGNKDTTYTLSPGTYYGGINISGNGQAYVTVLLKPGIYYMAGGGFNTGGNGQYTVKSVENDGVTVGGGVLIYNSVDPMYASQCATNPTYNPNPTDTPVNVPCLGTFSLTGSAGGNIWVRGDQTDPYKGLFLFQDRTVPQPQPTVTVAGYSTKDTMTGTIYAPKATCQVNGNGSGMSFQWICDIWNLNGNSDITIDYVPDNYIKPAAEALVK